MYYDDYDQHTMTLHDHRAIQAKENEYKDAVLESAVEALAAPVLGLVKKVVDELLVAVPQAAIDAVACRFADSLASKDQHHAARWLEDAADSPLVRGSSLHKDAMDFLGFDPVPDKVHAGFAAARARLESKLITTNE